MNMYFNDDPSTQVTLEWEPNIEHDLAGYKIYYGTMSGDYNFVVDVGNTTSYSIMNLTPGTTYYFSATAYSGIGIESGFSDEIMFMVPEEETETT